MWETLSVAWPDEINTMNGIRQTIYFQVDRFFRTLLLGML